MPPMKYWEIVGRKLTAAGWTWGYCSAVTRQGWRWTVDAHREDGRAFIALPAFEGPNLDDRERLLHGII